MVRKRWFWLVLTLFGLAVAGCNGGANKSAQLTSIEVTPTDPSIAVNTGQQFTATGIYSDHSTSDLTSSANWTSSDPAVAVVATSTGTSTAISAAMKTSGSVYGTGEGTATITASYQGKSGSSTIKVKRAGLVSISVTPTNPAIAKGTNQQFTATGTFSDNTTQDLTATVTWTSSNSAVAAISNAAGSAGLASSVGTGSATITATWTSISASNTLTVNPAPLVSIEVTPTNPGIAKGTSQQFTATGTFGDNTTQNLTASVAWSSSDTGVATIGANGVATSVAAGSATITATLGSISGSTILTVNPAMLVSIAVSPVNPAIAKGTTGQFSATGTFSDNTTQDLTGSVIWSSSNTAVATISNAAGSNGLASGLVTGTTTIAATSGGISGSTTLTVNPATLVSLAVSPADPAIAKGTKQQFAATGTYSDNSTQTLTSAVTWNSSNTGVATISNAAGSNGLATAVAAGSATIKATSGSISASTTLTVNPATLVSLAVTPANAAVGKGATQQFSASGTYSDSSSQNLTTAVTWSSSNTAVATISNAAGSNGLATAVAAGSATIKAISGSIAATATLTVSDGSAALAWDAPTTNTDGTPLTDLAGYKIHYGTSAGTYATTIDVGNVTSYTLTKLAPGTYYFAVTAYNSSGAESSFSNEASKAIQ